MKPSLQIFVLSHDRSLLDAVPKNKEFLTPVFLGDLDIDERWQGNLLAENRFFLSPQASNPAADFVGVVSARLLERDNHVRSFEALGELSSVMQNNSFWAPRYRRIWSPNAVDYWINSQDGLHPGMSRILRTVRDAWDLGTDEKRSLGQVFMGNQFVVHREEWQKFVAAWNAGLMTIEESFGHNPSFGYRCWNCHKLHPNGYWRYRPDRHLGFIGERVTAMHFANRDLLASSTTGAPAIPEPWSQSQCVPEFLLPQAGNIAAAIWPSLGIARRKSCTICKGVST